MKDDLSLDDVLLFLSVCDAGGLTGAVGPTGQSAPTLSRKMTALEQRTGRRLFHRGNAGYALTADGRALRAEAEALTELRSRLAAWSRRDDASRVRITAGTWTSRWLARSVGAYWTAHDPWVPEFLGSNAVLDIARREADIGFRNARPTQSWLAGRRMRIIEYAPFGRSDAAERYIALDARLPGTPSTRWVHRERQDRIATTVNDMRLALDLAREGVAWVVLPVFAGEGEVGMSQLAPTIEELTHEEWLVTHHDARHDPPVRSAIDAITRFIEAA